VIRALLRLLGFVALAGGFVAVVVDGVRAIATGAWAFAPLAGAVGALWPFALPQIEASVARNVHPLLAAWGIAPLAAAPACAVLGALGVALLWLGRRPRPRIGFAPRG
jgi:hypothetical protein